MEWQLSAWSGDVLKGHYHSPSSLQVVRTEISVDLPLENIQSICHVLPYAVYTLGASTD